MVPIEPTDSRSPSNKTDVIKTEINVHWVFFLYKLKQFQGNEVLIFYLFYLYGSRRNTFNCWFMWTQKPALRVFTRSCPRMKEEFPKAIYLLP